MSGDVVCIGPRRSAILLQSTLILAFASAVGAGLEWWGPLDGSPVGRLGEALGVPLTGLSIAAVGALIAGAMSWSSLRSLIEVRPTELTIAGHLGRFSIPFAQIEGVELLSSRDVGLTLSGASDWESTYEGRPEDLRKLQTMFGVMKALHGCEIVLESQRLDVGVDEFVDLLRQRLPAAH